MIAPWRTAWVRSADGRLGELVEQPVKQRARLDQLARESEGDRLAEQQPVLALRVLGAVRQQLERRPVPVRGGGRRPPGRRLRGLLEQRDRVHVARLGVSLDVVGAHGRGRAARGERRCHPCVRADPPRRPALLVDGTAQDRVAEPEPPERPRGPDEIALDQLVDARQRRLARDPGRGRRHLGLERIPRHRRRLDQKARRLRQRRELARRRRPHRRWDARLAGALRGTAVAGLCGFGVAHELFQIEGVAAAVLVQAAASVGGQLGRHQLARVPAAERGELDAGAAAAAQSSSARARPRGSCRGR